MIFAFDVAFEVGAVEVDVAKIARAVALGLIVEVGRRWVAAFAACGYCFCVYLFAELDDCDEAVAARAVPLIRSKVRTCAEGGE